MENLKGEIVENIELQNTLVRIVDIVNFEGPLLTLFENFKNRHLYLFDWIDKDAQYNRWLVYRCDHSMLNKFIKNELSHDDLFKSDESFCYVVNMGQNAKWQNIQKLEKSDLPNIYRPTKNDFFDKEDCPNLNKLLLFLEQKNWQQLRNLAKAKYAINKILFEKYAWRDQIMPNVNVVMNPIIHTDLSKKKVSNYHVNQTSSYSSVAEKKTEYGFKK